jgi:hypothetical protein
MTPSGVEIMQISTLCNELVMPTVYEHCELAVVGVAI